MEDHAIESEIKRIIVQVLELQIDPEEIGDEEILFGGGLGLDSIATLEIVVRLEEAFDIIVEDEELHTEMFESVRALSDYARSKIDA